MFLALTGGAHAATLYAQPDASGSKGPEGTFKSIITNTFGSFPEYPQPDGTPSYLLFRLKAPDLGPGGQVYLYADGGDTQCAAYIFNDADKAELSDGQYHTFNIETSFNYNSSICAGAPDIGFQVYEAGDGASLATNADGTLAYLVWSADPIPPPGPEGDGNTATHVISVTSPALYSISSTTPATVSFDAIDNGDANGYEIDYDQTNSAGQNLSRTTAFGWLGSYSTSTPFSVSTSTPALSEGKYKITVTLMEGSPDLPIPTESNPSYYFPPGAVSYFGVGSSTTFVLTPSSTRSYVEYASSSCAVNFTGSFSFSDCMGYLFTPQQQSLQQFGSLSLANTFPFAYAYQIGKVRSDVFAAPQTGSTTFSAAVPVNGSTWHITWLSASMISAIPYAGWIKGILTAIFWLLLAELVYYQIIRVHDKSPKV